MFSYNLGKCWVFPIWYVVKHRNLCSPAKHAKYSVNLSGKHSAFRKLLSTESCLIDLDWTWKLKIRQYFCLYIHRAALSNQLEILDDATPITHYILSQTWPHIVHVAEGRIHCKPL